ncbi:unnamed protein product [Callosobruchus maculatus]|uniref:Uncharacterized protein n=1 Tax=Callosobruchus maculatus TaxID=64391 RepID=A0A653BPU6_CALMS|nr:unnamed protein product [Callosobruchus maculatus]
MITKPCDIDMEQLLSFGGSPTVNPVEVSWKE